VLVNIFFDVSESFEHKNYGMIRIFIIVALVLVSLPSTGQSPKQKEGDSDEINQIKKVLYDQSAAWSAGDLETFMNGYWKSDSLMFIGSKGITYGWDQTLANYKRGYPDKAHTGKLDFEIHHLQKVGAESYFMIGKFKLTREVGDASGYFSLLWKKIDGQWKIIVDHT
jgi:ketosteroid isomerase-like protein